MERLLIPRPQTSKLTHPEGEGYGTAPYGTSAYGNPLESALVHRLGRGRIRSHRFRFENSEDQANVIVTGWETESALPYRPRFKK